MLSNTVYILDGNTSVIPPLMTTTPVQHALDIFERDRKKVFGNENNAGKQLNSSTLVVRYAGNTDPVYGRNEAFILHFCVCDGNVCNKMEVVGSDDLGIIYGLLYISAQFLGVEPFWFWQEKDPERREYVEIPGVDYISPEPRVRFRGWFVNDEVCLIGWTDIYPPPKEVWFPVFEALLRCGGNMVIPGTDLPRHGIHWNLASEMGLYITHHHAEPLGAEMFCRAFPDKEASYDRFSILFDALWEESVKKQQDRKVIWVLGFRGQGDCPFWEQDKSYDTPEKRGELISRAIQKQHEIVNRYIKNPVFCTYLYGEITELYRKGHIRIPEGTIKIWADNGYGKMVSRRQWNNNPRVPSLPAGSEAGPHGLYYHITFHDLQASNHLTMFPTHPELIRGELLHSFESRADHYLLLNCGNIRPHVYLLEIIARMWTDGDINIAEHLEDFCKRYYPSAWKEVSKCYLDFFSSTIKYGENEDDRAGDEFYHHAPRSMISLWMKGETEKTNDYLLWATGDIGFKQQFAWFHDKLAEAAGPWERLMDKCTGVLNKLDIEESKLFNGTVFLQVKLHYTGCMGVINLCKSFFAYEEEKYPQAFVLASQSLWNYKESLKAMQDAEFGMWKNFYRADWLTNVRGTIYCVEALQRFIRMHGDSPDFFWWFREHIVPDSEKGVLLENTTRRMLSDDELAIKLIDKLK